MIHSNTRPSTISGAKPSENGAATLSDFPIQSQGPRSLSQMSVQAKRVQLCDCVRDVIFRSLTKIDRDCVSLVTTSSRGRY